MTLPRPSLINPDGSPMRASNNGVRRSGPPRNSAIEGWNPPRRHPDAFNRERHRTAGRVREMTETDGYTESATTKKLDAVIGSRLRLKYKPNASALGVPHDDLREFTDSVQALWEDFANDPRFYCDATRQTNMSGLFALGYRHFLTEADAIADIGYDESRPWGMTVRIVDPDLMCNPKNARDTAEIRGGVEIDADGVAVAYHFRGAHEAAPWTDPRRTEWTRVPREDEGGCPFVIHYFDRRRDGQTRGRSLIDTVIEALKMEDKHSRVELQAAVLDAVMAPYIKTAMDLDLASDLFGHTPEDGEGTETDGYLIDRAAFYEGRGQVEIDGVVMNRLYPGDEMGVAEGRRPSSGFADFSSVMLRRIASGLGITYEQMTSDWTNTNYSSARAALNEIWRSWSQSRADFVARFCAPIFACWFEEAVMHGDIVLPAGAPDFHAAYGAWVNVEALGPGKGFVDPVKEVEAAFSRVKYGFSTRQDEIAELTGRDIRDIDAQLLREFQEAPAGFIHPALGGGGDRASLPQQVEMVE